MKKRKYLFSAFMTFIVVGGIIYLNNPPKEISRSEEIATGTTRSLATQNPQSPAQQMTLNDSKVERKELPGENVPKSTITQKDLQSLRGSLPFQDKVNAEFSKRPHTTPQSLAAFARELGPLMEKSYKNESDAKLLFGELQECALDDSVALAARALCVEDTEKLGEHHPKMKGKAQELRASVAPEVQKILDTNDAFIKK